MHTALVAIGAVSLALWLAVLLAPVRPWDLQPVGEDAEEPPSPADWPEVCAVVPARNEEAYLPRTLPALLAQDYPGRLRVLVVDDRSSDGTAAAARAAGAELVEGAPLPEGWVGKVWALEQGARAVGAPDYLLLTDADILHAPGSLRRLVAESEAWGLALNSRMALLRAETGWERLLVPPFLLFFNLLYPMRWANDPRRRLAAAAGGCILLRRGAASFEQIRGAVIDDVSLARAVKRGGGRLRLAVSRADVASLRAHGSLGPLWRMVARTAWVQLGRSWTLLAATLTCLALLFPVPVLLLAAVVYEPLAAALGALAWGCSSLVFRPAVRHFGLGRAWSWTLPLAGTLYGAMTLDSALRRRGDWS
ncbi:MAG TPA: glycosyltransferase [Gaiellaceae bacterium]